MQINDGSLKKGEKEKVKVSGDGARMSRLTNSILVSFTILQQGDILNFCHLKVSSKFE